MPPFLFLCFYYFLVPHILEDIFALLENFKGNQAFYKRFFEQIFASISGSGK